MSRNPAVKAFFRTGLVLLVALLPCTACSRLSVNQKVPASDGEATGAMRAEPPRPAWPEQARQLAMELTVERLAAQVLMTGLPDSGGLSVDTAARLAALQPGALVFFRYNLPSGIPAIQEYLTHIGRLCAVVPFLAIDHEGGLVQRFAGETTRLPAASVLGSHPRATELAATSAAIAGSELAALGFSMNLAPVVEAGSGPAAAVLATRTWSADAGQAAELSAAYIRQSSDSGMAAVAKHFPGTGSSDPHQALAALNASQDTVTADYLDPFSLVIRAEPAAIMLSLVTVPVLDGAVPVVFSQAIITDILKTRLGYRGIVMSDDLIMKALTGWGSLPERAIKALESGVDLVMVSSLADAERTQAAILAALKTGSLSEERLRDAATRILEQKLRFGLLDSSGNAIRRGLPEPSAVPSLLEANAARLRSLLASDSGTGN